MDAIGDPLLPRVTVKKSARVGFTQCLNNAVGYAIAQAPRHIMIVQPTVEDADDYSKDEIEAVLEWPCIEGKVVEGGRKSGNTIRRKVFPGGSLRIVGANSPRAFRRVTLDHIYFDEVDGYPDQAGTEGDQIELGEKRTLTSDQSKSVVGSTPTETGRSRIAKRFEESDQRFYFVPCPHCGEMQTLVWGDGTGPGIRWPKDRPQDAYYVCVNGCEIDEIHKPAMLAAGKWIATKPEVKGHAGFHIWAGYSLFENAAWGVLAAEFLRVKDDPNKLRVFVNTVLAETFDVKGEAPEWRRLYDRREDYRPGTVPMGGMLITVGVDVQKDRLEVFVWAWGRHRQCWLIEKRVFPGSPFEPHCWAEMDAFMGEQWPHETGTLLPIGKLGIDTGYATEQVFAWCKRYPPALVVPLKGATSLGAPAFKWGTAIDQRQPGSRKKRERRVGLVGGHVLTLDLYGRLGLDPPTKEELAAGAQYPPGYVHLNHEADEEFCKQLGGDRWIEAEKKWVRVHANEALDGWKYARAVAIAGGLDNWTEARWRQLEDLIGIREPAQPAAEPEAQPPAPTPPATVTAVPRRRRVRSKGVSL